MIPMPSGVRVWIAAGHTDMRRGMQGLALQVQEQLKRDPHLCVGRRYVSAGSRSRGFRGALELRRHIISDAFQQSQHRILGSEASGIVAGDTCLFQPSSHHLDVCSGVAMRGRDVRMPEPGLDG